MINTLGTGYLNCLYAYRRKSASPVLNVLRYSEMCHCVIGWVVPDISEDHSASPSKVKQSKIWTWTPCSLKKDTLCSLKRLWPTQPRPLHHIPEDLNPQQLQCENLNFAGHTKCSLTFIRSSRRNSLWTFSLRGLSSCGFKVNNSWMAALNVTRLKLEYI
jgi:hypothetical protein